MAGQYILGAAGAISAYVFGNYYIRKRATPLPLEVVGPRMEVAGGLDILPLVSAVLDSLPTSFRQNLSVQNAAPKKPPPKDWWDHFREDPYSIQEVEKGKVWKVAYTMENFFALYPENKAFGKMLDMDFTTEKGSWKVMQGAEVDGRKASEQAHKDLEELKKFEALYKEKGYCEETVRAAHPNVLNMIVVKLNSGGLLLYCPVQVRDEPGFGKWLDSLGPVEWIVVGSSAHTTYIPSVIKRYPEAKIVAAKLAALKLQAAKALPKNKVDYDYTKEEDMAAVNQILEPEGVKLNCIHGDLMTDALIGVAHRVAMECDLIYSRSDGGVMALDKAEFDKYEPKAMNVRMFKWGLMTGSNSPNGALPAYRFWFMDPTCPLSSFALDPPKADGSSCRDMARSLRLALAQDFDKAVGVHINTMDRQNFRESIEKNWSWLDGLTLLE